MAYSGVGPGTGIITAPVLIPLVTNVQSTPNILPTRVGARYISLNLYPSILTNGQTRFIQFVANIETTGGTANIQLKNVTDNEIITGTILTSTSTINAEVSSTITVGISANNFKTNKYYAVQIFITNNASNDNVTCTNARLEITYI